MLSSGVEWDLWTPTVMEYFFCEFMADVSFVRSFHGDSNDEHMSTIKHILRYIAGTLHFECSHRSSGNEDTRLTVYSDVDLAGYVEDKKSMTGTIFFIGQCPITWQS